MTQITDDVILATLEKSYSSLHLQVMLFGIFVLVLGVVAFVLFKMDKKPKALGALIALLLIGVPLTRYFL